MGLTDEQIQLAADALGIDPSTLPSEHDVQALKRPSDPFDHLDHEDLSDDEYAALLPALPPEPRQRSAISNRQVLDGLLWQQATRRPLTQLPQRYGTSEAVRKRSERWAISGVWNTMVALIQENDPLEARMQLISRICELQAIRGKKLLQKRNACQFG